jgi:hypothetical protein
MQSRTFFCALACLQNHRCRPTLGTAVQRAAGHDAATAWETSPYVNRTGFSGNRLASRNSHDFMVLPAPNFSIFASPASQTIPIANTATFTLTVTPVNRFTGTVLLTCGGGPLSSTCKVSPASVTLNGSGSAMAKVTVSFARNSDTKGVCNLTLTATSGSLSHQSQVSVTVKD